MASVALDEGDGSPLVDLTWREEAALPWHPPCEVVRLHSLSSSLSVENARWLDLSASLNERAVKKRRAKQAKSISQTYHSHRLLIDNGSNVAQMLSAHQVQRGDRLVDVID